MKIREKSHRLPKDFYKGEVSIAFTLCLKENIQAFKDKEIVSVFTEMLTSTTIKKIALFLCIVSCLIISIW
jgi:hypothetical protein